MLSSFSLNPIQMGIFGAAHGWGGRGGGVQKRGVTYPTIMKLGIVILYLKIQKIYESRDTP